jgi:hypothetical protein
MIGISISHDGFQLMCGEPIGARRHLDATTVAALEEFGQRYGQLLDADKPAEDFLKLGRDLYGFLDGDGGYLTALIERTSRPLHFEIAAPTRRPDTATLALLRAPWELLANEQGYLAGDVALGFSPVRRLGRHEPPPAPDDHRLGVVFMAAAPRGLPDLEHEAEETAIMTAVGTSELDLLVEESGNPHELGENCCVP